MTVLTRVRWWWRRQRGHVEEPPVPGMRWASINGVPERPLTSEDIAGDAIATAAPSRFEEFYAKRQRERGVWR